MQTMERKLDVSQTVLMIEDRLHHDFGFDKTKCAKVMKDNEHNIARWLSRGDSVIRILMRVVRLQPKDFPGSQVG